MVGLITWPTVPGEMDADKTAWLFGRKKARPGGIYIWQKNLSVQATPCKSSQNPLNMGGPLRYHAYMPLFNCMPVYMIIQRKILF